MNTPILDYTGTDLFILASDLPPEAVSHLESIGGQGRQDDNVAAFLEAYCVTGNPEDCRAYLDGYGAWDEDELSDHNENLERLVWLTGCQIAEYDPEDDPYDEGPCAHFCTYG